MGIFNSKEMKEKRNIRKMGLFSSKEKKEASAASQNSSSSRSTAASPTYASTTASGRSSVDPRSSYLYGTGFGSSSSYRYSYTPESADPYVPSENYPRQSSSGDVFGTLRTTVSSRYQPIRSNTTSATGGSGRAPLREVNQAIDDLSSRFTAVSIDDDSPGTKGVIVGKPNAKCCIVQTLPEAGIESKYLVLDAESKNIGGGSKEMPLIQTIIKVKKLTMSVVPSTDPTFPFKLHVLEYILLEVPPTPIGQEVVAVSDFIVGVVTVVGHSFWEPTPIQWDNEAPVAKADFVTGSVNRLQPYFAPQIVNGIVCYVKDLQKERKDVEKKTQAKSNKHIYAAPSAPKRRYYMTDIRVLTHKEHTMIKTYCRYVKSLQLDWARLYIRDVCIAISRLEQEVQKQSAKSHTVIIEGATEVDRSGTHARLALTVKLGEAEVKSCLKSQAQETWRVGSDLSIRHPELERLVDKSNLQQYEKKYEGGMTVESIKYETIGATVRLRPHPRSYDLFDLIVRTKLHLTGKFTVGPMEDANDTITENLFMHFDRFFHNKALFDSWRGVGNKEITQIPDFNKTFKLKDRSLDQSQTQALRTAMAKDGFVCVEAPPGSGKTLLIAALVAAKHETALTDGAMCVSATTNNAISNAIDMVHEQFASIKVTREYSRRAEGEITQKSKQISLKEMALNAAKHVDLAKEPLMAQAIENYTDCKEEMGKVRDMVSGLCKLDELNGAYRLLRDTFLNTYRPFLMGSTCELVGRRGDPNAKKASECEDERKKKIYNSASITHLILDEASQLPVHLALAVYVSLPALKKITLIGDSAQLGPFTPLEEKTMAFNMVKFGELERVGDDKGSATKVHLKTIYRSHPRIVDILFKPNYGTELIAGLKPEARALAIDRGLPHAQDHHKSPVLFVSVDNAKCDRGVNEKEMEIVLTFIEELRRKKVSGEDVAVVCNHRAQREAITNRLKGKGDFGILNTSVAIHTVDSFQGKEAKVVLVLTTKACSNPKFAQRTFEFVANPNRGTVAVSRAQHAMYLFGDWKMLVRTVFWSRFVPGIMESQCLVDSLWKPAAEADYRKLSENALQSKPNGMNGQFAHNNQNNFIPNNTRRIDFGSQRGRGGRGAARGGPRRN